MANQNRKLFIQNIFLLLIIGALVIFIATRQEEQGKSHATLYDKSIGDNAKEVIIHSEGRDDVVLKNETGIWKVVKPKEFIADKAKVQLLFTLLSENAESSYDIDDKDLARYGLDKDKLSVSFNGVKIIFGKLNEVSRKRYVLKANKMYLVEETVSGLMEMGVDAFKSQDTPLIPQTSPELKPITITK